MNDRRRVFVSEYLKDFNATRAATAAGYSERTARQQGARLLHKFHVAEDVRRRIDELGVRNAGDVGSKRASRLPDHLYLIREDFYGLVKIGIAADPLSRLASLQTSCPQTLTLLWCTRAGAAKDIEAQLHTRYADKHHRGEWFRLTEQDIEDIKREWQG